MNTGTSTSKFFIPLPPPPLKRCHYIIFRGKTKLLLISMHSFNCLKNGKLPFTKYEYTISWLYRESTCFYLFLKAASNPTVKWREGTFRLKWGSRAIKIDDNGTGKNTPVKNPPSPPPSPTKIMLNEQEILSNSSSSSSSSSSSNSSVSLNSKKNKNLEKLIIVPETTANGKLGHKRTNSYSVTNKPASGLLHQHSNHYHQHQQQQQHQAQLNQQYSASDMENSYTPLLNTTSNHLDLHHPSQQLKTPLNQHHMRSHHHHHHSISSPFSSASFNQQLVAPQTTALTAVTTINMGTPSTPQQSLSLIHI